MASPLFICSVGGIWFAGGLETTESFRLILWKGCDKMLDLICLWIGRIVLTVLVLIPVSFIIYAIGFSLRRPYYCIKHLLPKKHQTQTQWADYQKAYDVKREILNWEWPHDFHFSQKGHIGKMVDFGEHKWWEPKNRFFWIK